MSISLILKIKKKFCCNNEIIAKILKIEFREKNFVAIMKKIIATKIWSKKILLQ